MTSLMLHPVPHTLISPYTPKLFVTTEGELATVDSLCCNFIGPHMAIIINKQNTQSLEDVLVVILNGVNIGTINNNQLGLTGRIFATTDRITPLSLNINNSNFDPTIEIPFSSFLHGTNTLRVESIERGSSVYNTGYVSIEQLVCYEYEWAHMKSYLPALTKYDFLSTVGNGQTFTFQYP
jgi:hypothetical protein